MPCAVSAYPEINVEVPAPAKFPVADLEGHCHFVVLVQLLVEALALMRLHLNVVRRGEAEQAARRCEKTESIEQHCCKACGLARYCEEVLLLWMSVSQSNVRRCQVARKRELACAQAAVCLKLKLLLQHVCLYSSVHEPCPNFFTMSTFQIEKLKAVHQMTLSMNVLTKWPRSTPLRCVMKQTM